MTKETAKDIAIALIATSGEQFDLFAFTECNISEKDRDKIIDEIKMQCSKMIQRVETKYNARLGNEKSDIIDEILTRIKPAEMTTPNETREPGTCRECGCTWDDPCFNPHFGTCWWEDDTETICSHCADPDINNDPATEHCINSSSETE